MLTAIFSALSLRVNMTKNLHFKKMRISLQLTPLLYVDQFQAQS